MFGSWYRPAILFPLMLPLLLDVTRVLSLRQVIQPPPVAVVTQKGNHIAGPPLASPLLRMPLCLSRHKLPNFSPRRLAPNTYMYTLGAFSVPCLHKQMPFDGAQTREIVLSSYELYH